MKKVTFEDLYSFNFLSDVTASPDGRHIVFQKHNACKETNGYKSYLWLMDTETGAVKPLSFGGGERGAKWLDNETIMFSANRAPAKEVKTDFYQLSLKGGEAQPFISIPERVTALEPLGGDKYVGVIVKHCEGKEQKAEDEALDGRDLLVFDETYFWFNGQGIRNKIRNSLVIYDAQAKEYSRVTSQYFNLAAFAVSPDKSKIAFTGAAYENKVVNKNGLYVYDLASGETKTLLEQGEMVAGAIAFVGENELFCAINDFEWSGKNSRFYVYDIESGERRALPFVDAEVGGASGTDVNYGGGQNKKLWGGKLYMTRAVWGDSHLCAMDMKTGEDITVSGVKGSINGFDIAGGKAYAVALRGSDLPEIYSIDLSTGCEKKLTSFNSEYIESHIVTAPEYFTFVNKDGFELDGYVIKPAGYKPGKKYPAVFEIHGGPKTIFGSVFHHEMQILSSLGYFVFYTNPRGSDGRGEDFAYSTKFLGTKDYEDLMEFCDVVCEKYPDINEKKIGICGGSYGGFMCNWMIGHTDRFAAAASQRSISNYVCKLTATDIGTTYDLQQVGATPWEDFELVWETSPLKYAHNAKTPTLFIQSDEDYRCWMSGALQMFSALKQNGTDARLCMFHGENHELSRGGRPENRISRLTEICGWFDKYLKK